MRFLKDDGGIGTGLPNVLALVDVFLFLLLATVGGATARNLETLDIRLAKVPKSAGTDVPTKLFKVLVKADGTYRVMKKPIDLAEVRAKVGRLRPGTIVMVAADRDARHADVAVVISSAQEFGLTCVLQVEKEAAR